MNIFLKTIYDVMQRTYPGKEYPPGDPLRSIMYPRLAYECSDDDFISLINAKIANSGLFFFNTGSDRWMQSRIYRLSQPGDVMTAKNRLDVSWSWLMEQLERDVIGVFSFSSEYTKVTDNLRSWLHTFVLFSFANPDFVTTSLQRALSGYIYEEVSNGQVH